MEIQNLTVKIPYLLCLLFLVACSKQTQKASVKEVDQYLTILGTAQDGGYPHIGCQKECCANYYKGLNPKQHVVALGLVDLEHQQKWLFEATPDLSTQLAVLENEHLKSETLIDGVFLTHAHIGHYTGLMYFGREAYGKKNIPVYAMPKMKRYLTENGPWSQLVHLENITLKPIFQDSIVTLNARLQVIPFKVPHRDEYSETVGYKIIGPRKTALFIPDINKWEQWGKDIVTEVAQVDYAFIDATFFKSGEINRPMAEVPHPFIEETVALFKDTPRATKQKIIFIHFNHTNPVLQPNAPEKNALLQEGFRFAVEGQSFAL